MAKRQIKWTDAEIEELRQVYEKYPRKFPRLMLERHGQSGCSCKAALLGLARKVNHWTGEEVEQLKQAYKTFPAKLPSSLIKKHKEEGCYTKASRLGLSRNLRSPGLDLRHLTQSDRGYIAGFLDGEGSICLNIGIKKINPRVSFANTHLGSIEWLQEKCAAGGINVIKREKINPKYKTLYQLSIAGTKNVYDLLRAIVPYMIIKKGPAEKAISFLEKKYNL